ncbi:hypothetical protein BC628DRAFT_763555 [Trametes gibbosa]|nr:hypothetical protein BC628DRAFT_763555 [Trametes gibbosa]
MWLASACSSGPNASGRPGRAVGAVYLGRSRRRSKTPAGEGPRNERQEPLEWRSCTAKFQLPTCGWLNIAHPPVACSAGADGCRACVDKAQRGLWPVSGQAQSHHTSQFGSPPEGETRVRVNDAATCAELSKFSGWTRLCHLHWQWPATSGGFRSRQVTYSRPSSQRLRRRLSPDIERRHHCATHARCTLRNRLGSENGDVRWLICGRGLCGGGMFPGVSPSATPSYRCRGARPLLCCVHTTRPGTISEVELTGRARAR